MDYPLIFKRGLLTFIAASCAAMLIWGAAGNVKAQECQTTAEAMKVATDAGGEVLAIIPFDGVLADTAIVVVVGDALQFGLFKDDCFVGGAYPMAQVNADPVVLPTVPEPDAGA